MNLRNKRCLFGLLTWAVLAASASAQPGQPEGSVRLGTPDGQLPAPLTPLDNMSGQVNVGNTFGYTTVGNPIRPRFNMDTRGGGLYGYDPGYTNLGAFVPFELESDESLIFIDARGMVTHDGAGGANAGLGWRHWIDDLDRIVGVSAWYDFDNGHQRGYHQIGLSFESLGRYLDYRVNGYIPVGTRSTILSSTVNPADISFRGNSIVFARTNTGEQSFTGFDAELGGPLPVIGRYGVNGYIGGYHFRGNGDVGGSFTGVSGRWQAQINEDLTFGMQVTDDHEFGTNVQFQVAVTLPDGAPSRWLRNPRVQERLTQSVFRQYRVMANVESFTTYDEAINPRDGLPYFVAHIDPNATANGTGAFRNPFPSVAAYLGQPVAGQQLADIIYVRPRLDDTNTNLDTAPTLTLFDGQRLLSTSVQHTFTSANFPGQNHVLPGFVAGALPQLFNSAGGNVITLAPNALSCIEVSGFDITGSATGNGISGMDNTFVLINRNNIHDALNGVVLNNLSGTTAAGTAAIINDNIFDSNLNDGVQINNTGTAPLELLLAGNTASNNGDDGVDINADAGSSILIEVVDSTTNASTFTGNGDNGLELGATAGSFIGGLIEGNLFADNTGDGLHIDADASTVDFGDTTIGSVITENDFNNNDGSGIEVVAINDSILRFNINANRFGDAAVVGSGNRDDAIRISADGGLTNLIIGGDTAAEGNVLVGNLDNGIVLNLTGDSVNTVDIGFNTISLGAGGGGGNIFLTGHDVDFHSGQNDFDTIILDYLRGVGTTTVTPADQYSLAVIGSGAGNWSFTGGAQVKAGYESTTFFDTNALIANPALWDQVFASDGIIILSHTSVGGGDLDDAGVAEVNSQAARFAAAISSGTDVWANSGADNANYYNFLPPSIVATGAPLFGATGFVATPAGVAIGITDVAPNSMINGFPTHNSFNSFDPNFTVYETRTLNGITESVSIGVQNAQVGAGGFVRPGGDGIRVNIEDSAIVTTADIHDNTVTGYGTNGIHVLSSGTSQFPDLTIRRNTVTGSGNGISLERNDSSLMNAVINNNIVTGNAVDGLVVVANGTDLPNMTLTSFDNTFSNNGGNGMSISAFEDATIIMESDRDLATDNEGHGVFFSAGDTASITATLRNITATGNTQNGLFANIFGAATFDLDVSSPVDPLYTGTTGSTFSNNGQDGFGVSTNSNGLALVTLDDILFVDNGRDGLNFNREGASLILAQVTNSTVTGNADDGIQFYTSGASPADASQPLSGTSNQLTLNNVLVNDNGVVGAENGGNGLETATQADSTLIMDITLSSFSNNATDGVRSFVGGSGSFGTSVIRGTFDGVTITENGRDGIKLFAQGLAESVPASFIEVNSDSGSTLIADNGDDGIQGTVTFGAIDILVQGNTLGVPNFTTRIQRNGDNGIEFNVGDAAVDGDDIADDPTLPANQQDGDADGAGNEIANFFFPTGFQLIPPPNANFGATGTLTVLNTVVGDENLNDTIDHGNGGDGVEVWSSTNFNYVNRYFPAPGQVVNNVVFSVGSLANVTIDDTEITGNNGHGLNITGDGHNSQFTGFNLINASVTDTHVARNSLNGVNIDLEGRYGFTQGFIGGPPSTFLQRTASNSFVFDNNLIELNGQNGVFYQSNAGDQQRLGTNGSVNSHIRIDFQGPQPTTPATPFDPDDVAQSAGSVFNSGDNTTDTIVSGFLNLRTDLNSDLVFTNNTVQFNGVPQINNGDGVFIRVGTDTYLSADMGGAAGSGNGNIFSGNALADVHFESFIAFDPATGNVINPPASTANAAPTADVIFLDDTAQLDLRFNNNTADQVSAPFVLQPNQAAIYTVSDALKRGGQRAVQLFQVDDGNNLDANNNVPLQNLPLIFNSGNFHLRTVADGLFPNPSFPENYADDPGDPFLP